jgi:hypothetical protein
MLYGKDVDGSGQASTFNSYKISNYKPAGAVAKKITMRHITDRVLFVQVNILALVFI